MMIVNVRGCTSRPGIIVSYLTKNKEETGYSSFSSKKFIAKSRTDILTAIKKTLVLTRKTPVIKADALVSTVDKISKKTTCDTSAKLIVKATNEENMLSRMLSLSYIHFNGKPLSRIKAINVVNDNMYFMIKKGPDYILELIENEKIQCMISINSLVKLYRLIKLKIEPPNSFKSMYTRRITNTGAENIGGAWRNSYEYVVVHPEREGAVAEENEIVVELPTAESVETENQPERRPQRPIGREAAEMQQEEIQARERLISERPINRATPSTPSSPSEEVSARDSFINYLREFEHPPTAFTTGATYTIENS